MFGFSNLGEKVPTYMPLPHMIMYELSWNLDYTTISYMVVTPGLDRIGMNYDCVGPTSLTILYK